MLALGAAAAAVVFEGAKLAISASDMHDDLLAAFSALAGGDKAGQAVMDTIRGLSSTLPQGEEQLSKWSKALLSAGLPADKLAQSLTAVAGAGTLAEGGSEKLLGILSKLSEAGEKGTKFKFSFAQLAGTGVSESELLAKLGFTPKTFEAAKKAGKVTGANIAEALTSILAEKTKGTLEGNINDLEAIWMRFKGNVRHIFEGLGKAIDPFLKEVSKLGDMFSQDSATGQTMKLIVTQAFTAIFNAATKVLPYIRRGFLLLTIAALQVWIALKPLGKEIANLWTQMTYGKDGASTMQSFADALSFAVSMASKFIAGAIMVVEALQFLYAKFNETKDAASALIDGLVDGINNGSGLVMDAIRNLGTNAITTLKNAILSHSPSKAFEKIGFGGIAAGLAGGIDAGAPMVSASVGDMAGGAMGAASAYRSGQGGGQINITVEPGAIVINGASGDGAEMTETALATLLERLALEQGLGAS